MRYHTRLFQRKIILLVIFSLFFSINANNAVHHPVWEHIIQKTTTNNVSASFSSLPINYTRLSEFANNTVDTGLAPDAIPPIDNPIYWNVSEANSFLQDEDLVFGFTIAGESMAFPQRILVWHEIVNTATNTSNVSIIYNALTGSIVAFNQTLQNTTITTTFGTSGKLLNSNLVMYDRNSGSYWPQLIGQAINGTRLGERLQRLQLYWTSWSLWKAQFPNTLVLSNDTGYIRNYNVDPYGSYTSNTSYYQTGGPIFPVMQTDARLSDKDVIIGIDSNGAQLSVQKEYLKQEKVINSFVGNESIVLLYDESLDTARVYSRDINGNTLNFTFFNGLIVDDNGSVWDHHGKHNLSSMQLNEIVYMDAFWFAWVAFFPETELIAFNHTTGLIPGFPYITNYPADRAITKGSLDNVLTWVASGQKPSNYTVYQNGTPITTGIWKSAEAITINVDGLAVGSWNYTIIITNSIEQHVVHSVLVTVLPVLPQFLEVPANVSFREGTALNVQLLWLPIDDNPAYYQLVRNGVILVNSSWMNGTSISTNIDNLTKGLWNFTLIITDSDGHRSNHTTFVTVLEPLAMSSPSSDTISTSSAIALPSSSVIQVSTTSGWNIFLFLFSLVIIILIRLNSKKY